MTASASVRDDVDVPNMRKREWVQINPNLSITLAFRLTFAVTLSFPTSHACANVCDDIKLLMNLPIVLDEA